jgi:hypothetical protein
VVLRTTTEALTMSLGYNSTTHLEAPNKYTKVFTWRKLRDDLFCMKARSTEEGWGIYKSLG